MIHNIEDFKADKWESQFSQEGPKTLRQIGRDHDDKVRKMQYHGTDSKARVKKPRKRNDRRYSDDEEKSDSDSYEGEEYEKIDEGKDDINFMPQRGTKPTPKRANKTPKMTAAKAKEKMSNIFELTDKTEIEFQLKDFCVNHPVSGVLSTYLENFHDGRVEDVILRLWIPGWLVTNQGLEPASLSKTFRKKCDKMILEAADYPGLFKYYGNFLKEWVLENKYFTLESMT